MASATGRPRRSLAVLRRPGLWFIAVILAVLAFIHYSEVMGSVSAFSGWLSFLGLDRHAFERILFLAPIVWAGFCFGWKGAFLTSLVALAVMLPRVFLISDYPLDAGLETLAVFLIGNVLAIAFASLWKERDYRERLRTAHEEQERITAELRLAQQNLRYYLQQATMAQEEERKRISHELHDDTIQSLVVLSRELDELLSTETAMSDAVRATLEELWHRIDGIVKDVRRLSQDLRPAALDQLGLLPALEWLAANLTEYAGIPARVRVSGTERILPEEEAVAIFRICQEAMRNIWRHAGASSAELFVEFTNAYIRVTIRDDGAGFDVPAEPGQMARAGKLGITGMQERAQLIGGTLTVISRPGQGTAITLELAANGAPGSAPDPA